LGICSISDRNSDYSCQNSKKRRAQRAQKELATQEKNKNFNVKKFKKICKKLKLFNIATDNMINALLIKGGEDLLPSIILNNTALIYFIRNNKFDWFTN
jgi:hypothetical protein